MKFYSKTYICFLVLLNHNSLSIYESKHGLGKKLWSVSMFYFQYIFSFSLKCSTQMNKRDIYAFILSLKKCKVITRPKFQNLYTVYTFSNFLFCCMGKSVCIYIYKIWDQNYDNSCEKELFI